MGYRENLLEAIKDDTNHPLQCGIPMQIHHLLSKAAAKRSGAKLILESYGYDINKLENLVALPCTFAGACHLGVQLHRGDHTSSSNNDDDDEHNDSYHDHVQKIIVNAIENIENNCEGGDDKKVQDRMNKKSKTVLDDIIDYRIRLTRVHIWFKEKNSGCNGLGKINEKFSIDDLVKSKDNTNNNCDREHAEFELFPKQKYNLKIGK